MQITPSKIWSIAILGRKPGSNEEREANDKSRRQIAKREGIDLGFVDRFVDSKIDPDNAVLGPFTLLAQQKNPSGSLKAVIPEASQNKYNPIVLNFLKSQTILPNDLAAVEKLVETFWTKTVVPRSGEILHWLTNPALPVPKNMDPNLWALAVFPTTPIDPRSFNTNDNFTKLYRDSADKVGIDPNVELNKINQLRYTHRGGPIGAMIVRDAPEKELQDSPICPRGNRPADFAEAQTIPRGFIKFLSPDGNTRFTHGSGRLELATTIASKSNPLTARTMVNRVWMHHFGDGFTRTPDDLGTQGGTPVHAELLDYLTSYFLEDHGPTQPAWSLKSLHRLIMLSNTYQQSSRNMHLARQEKLDPANTLFWHTNVRRLDFEAFRDALLSMSGTLDLTMFGPSVELMKQPYSTRRSVYGLVDRKNVSEVFRTFDFASPQEPNSKRVSTIVPQQALFLMNSTFAAKVTQRIVQQPTIVQAVSKEHDARRAILMIFQTVLQRTPSKQEYDLALAFLKHEAAMQNSVSQAKGSALSPWETLVQSLLFCNEAAYIN